ncbi:uncharacterized protein [Scyliorhinus torazame]|uniref:uncharacterized protein n=1 Tax=Scyliorhinus torazame TaxID=75743 RepID=UPI003B5AC974
MQDSRAQSLHTQDMTPMSQASAASSWTASTIEATQDSDAQSLQEQDHEGLATSSDQLVADDASLPCSSKQQEDYDSLPRSSAQPDDHDGLSCYSEEQSDNDSPPTLFAPPDEDSDNLPNPSEQQAATEDLPTVCETSDSIPLPMQDVQSDRPQLVCTEALDDPCETTGDTGDTIILPPSFTRTSLQVNAFLHVLTPDVQLQEISADSSEPAKTPDGEHQQTNTDSVKTDQTPDGEQPNADSDSRKPDFIPDRECHNLTDGMLRVMDHLTITLGQ